MFTSIVVSIVVLFASILIMTKLASLKTLPTEAKNGERPLQVEVLQVEKDDFPIIITGYGEVKALNVVPILKHFKIIRTCSGRGSICCRKTSLSG